MKPGEPGTAFDSCGPGDVAGVASGSVDAGMSEIHRVPENRTTDTERATGRMADRALG